MAKFAANNNESISIKLFPFFATKDLHPHISFDKVKLFNASICKQIFNQKALDISGNMYTIQKFVQKALIAVQESQSKQANKH